MKNEPKNLLEYIKQTLEEHGDSWDNVVAIWIPENASYAANGIKICVPNCYGTFEEENKNCTVDNCATSYFCRDETFNLQEIVSNKPKEMENK